MTAAPDSVLLFFFLVYKQQGNLLLQVARIPYPPHAGVDVPRKSVPRSAVYLRCSLWLAWGVTVLWFTMIPVPPVPHGGVLGWDKLQHAAALGIFTFLGGRALALFCHDQQRCWLKAFLIAVAFGALIEVLQGLCTTTRSAEVGDLLADAVGAGIACIVVLLWQRTTTLS